MKSSGLFTKSDRRGLLMLEWLAILALVLLWAFTNRNSHHQENPSSLVSDSITQNRKKKTSRTYTYAVPETPVESFPFDPNTADSTTLLRLGLAPWQVQAIYRYRAKHGRYHTAEDFKRVPGMTLELWERLGKYVTIDKKFRYLDLPPKARSRVVSAPVPPKRQQTDSSARIVKADTLPVSDSIQMDTLRYPVKFEEITLVDINAADTNLLKKIPNIGSFRATEIVRYRERLGGYTNVEQVMEACEMPDEVLEWFSLIPVPVRTLNVNRLSVRQLMRHPYVSFYQAREIVEYRKKHGPIHQIEELASLDKFSSDDIERLRPYLIFQ